MKELKIELTYRVKDDVLNDFIDERQGYNDKYQHGDKYDINTYANNVCEMVEDLVLNNDDLCCHAGIKLISINELNDED